MTFIENVCHLCLIVHIYYTYWIPLKSKTSSKTYSKEYIVGEPLDLAMPKRLLFAPPGMTQRCSFNDENTFLISNLRCIIVLPAKWLRTDVWGMPFALPPPYIRHTCMYAAWNSRNVIEFILLALWHFFSFSSFSWGYPILLKQSIAVKVR